MEEINYKLDSNNPVLITHAVSKLLTRIRTKVGSDSTIKDVSQIAEYKLLLSKYKNNNPLLTAAICQALLVFAECGILTITSALSTLSTCLSTTINYPSITVAITHLLIVNLKSCLAKGSGECPHSSEMQQHPFIIILNREKNSWQIIINQMKYMMNHSDQQVKDNSVKILRPVFLYVLCNPSVHTSIDCKLQMWELLIKSNGTFKLQIEIMQWLQTSKLNACVDTNCKILQLAELTLCRGDTEYFTALTPILTSLILRLFEYGFDPRPNFDVIIGAIDHCDNYTINIILGLIIEIITVCPVTHLQDILEICDTIITKAVCNITLLNALVAALLKWLAYSSILCSDALQVAHKLIQNINLKAKSYSEPSEIAVPRLIAMLIHIDPNIQLYTEILQSINKGSASVITSWVERLSSAPIDIRYRCKSVLCGLFLQSTDPETTKKLCDVLIQIVKEFNCFASHMLSLVLYKLTKIWDCGDFKHLLFALPELVIAKENVPIVVNTLETLTNNDGPLKYLAIGLYLKAVEREPRCYRFLSTALMSTMKNDKSWHSDVTCANAMAYICTTHPEYGTELVPLLSQILNRCTDVSGGTATALALKSISGLCQSAVIGICSTWRILAPKMMKEERTIVLESLCELLGNIPYFPSQSGEEYDNLIISVLTRLWMYASSSDVRVAQSAFKALTSYRLEHIPLRTLPSEFKRNLVVPPVYAKMKTDDTQNPEDFIPYVPCICWVQMLQKINKTVLSSAGDMLISYIKIEVESFKSGIYIWPQGEPNDYKYLPEKSVIRGVGEYLKRSRPDGESEKRVITECLRIFAYKYNKPLPNIKWTFLDRAMSISDRAKEYCLLIASHHSVVSASARVFIEKYLSMYKVQSNLSNMLQSREYLILYSNLENLSQGVQQHYLEPFLERTLDHVLEKVFFKNTESVELFNNIMSSYTSALKNEEAREGNRTLISNILEKILDKIDLSSGNFDSYITAISQLSNTDIERITSPSVWWDVTPNKLRNAIIIRTELALKTDAESLNWMNEPIDVAASTPAVQVHLLESMRKVQTIMRCEKSSASWTLNFISRIQNVISELPEGDTEKLIFYIDILFISTICLSATECLLLEKDAVITSREVRIRLFPQAISILADRQYWKDIIPQVMDWLDYMRTSSIPESYKSSFHNCLISLRHESHFQNSWTKYLSAKCPTQM